MAIACLAIIPIPLGFFKPASTAASTDGPPWRDTFESYTDGVDASGLNGGTGWNGGYVDRPGALGIQNQDAMETYTDGANLDALNGGAGWGGPYVDR